MWGGGGGGLGTYIGYVNIVGLGDSDYDLYILGGVVRAVGLGMLISGEGAGSETDMEDVHIMGGGGVLGQTLEMLIL